MPQPERLELAARVATRLGEIEGVAAVVLGGSQARGTATPASDVDLGIYYHPSRPLDLIGLDALACELDDRHPGHAVTAIGEWGPWVNGGAWLRIEGCAVDWLYRDVQRVTEVIEEARQGRYGIGHVLGYPGGFPGYVYLAELEAAVPLHDPEHVVSALRLITARYPEPLRESAVARGLFDARFALDIAVKSAERADVTYACGSLHAAAIALVQVLFALNRRYYPGEKGALPAVADLPLRPSRFAQAVEGVLGRAGTTPSRLLASAERLRALAGEVAALCRAELPGTLEESEWRR